MFEVPWDILTSDDGVDAVVAKLKTYYGQKDDLYAWVAEWWWSKRKRGGASNHACIALRGSRSAEKDRKTGPVKACSPKASAENSRRREPVARDWADASSATPRAVATIRMGVARMRAL